MDYAMEIDTFPKRLLAEVNALLSGSMNWNPIREICIEMCKVMGQCTFDLLSSLYTRILLLHRNVDRISLELLVSQVGAER